MMALISDIHGNLPALKAVLEDISNYPVTEIISLGDVAGYYPMINECIELLQYNNVKNVLGNHDFYLINEVSCKRSRTVDLLIRFQRSIIAQENLDWLALSATKIEKGDCSFVHGGWRRGFEEYIYKLNPTYFEALPFRFFFAGHTHVQYLHHFENGQVFCNPGSVGQPRDGHPQSAWALFDGKQITLKRVAYDITLVENSMAELGFPENLTKNLYTGSRINGKFDRITQN